MTVRGLSWEGTFKFRTGRTLSALEKLHAYSKYKRVMALRENQNRHHHHHRPCHRLALIFCLLKETVVLLVLFP